MSGEGQPTLTIIGGPNGSGRSTLTSSSRVRDRIPVIDPDAIARELRPDAPAAVSVESGSSFAIETTLSGHTPLRLMAEVRERGYTVNLIYMGLNDPRTNIKRHASVFDNSSDQGPVGVLTYDSGNFRVPVAELPLWVATYLKPLLQRGQR